MNRTEVLAHLYALEHEHGVLGHTAAAIAQHAGGSGAGPTQRLGALEREGLVWRTVDDTPGTRGRRLYGLTGTGRRAGVSATHELRAAGG